MKDQDGRETPLVETRITLNLSAAVAILRAQESPKANQYICFVNARNPRDLHKIKSGTNPRDYNPRAKVVEGIGKTYLEREGFSVFNGGLQMSIDADSVIISEDRKEISFTCDNPGNGCYDGEHTKNTLLDILASNDFKTILNQSVIISLVEDSFWKDSQEQREAAACWNNRQSQKCFSVENQRGAFDNLKSSLDEKHLNLIKWKENQMYKNSMEIIPDQNSITIVSMLASQAIAVQDDLEYTSEFARLAARKGTKISSKLWETATSVSGPIVPHVSSILDLTDYIQSSWSKIPEHRKKRVLRKHSKKNFLEKEPSDCKAYVYTKFGERKSVDYAIHMEFLYVIMQGLLKATMLYDERANTLSFKYKIEEIEKLWDTMSAEVLARCEDIFLKLFEPMGYRSVQILDNEAVWSRIATTIGDHFASYEEIT